MASVIKNPSGKTYFYGKTGSAITAQPTLKMTAKALGSSQTGTGGGVTNVGHGKNMKWYTYATNDGSRLYAGKRTQIMGARLDTAITGATVAASGGFAKYTKASHGLSVNDIIFVSEANNKVTGIQRVKSIDGNDFTTSMPYVSGADATITIKKCTGTIALNVAGRFLAYQHTTNINGVASNVLKSPGKQYEFQRSIKKFVSSGRNPKVGAAIRAGYWNVYTATWSTAPVASNDSIGNVAGSTVTDGSADDAAKVGRLTAAELVYRDGSKTVKKDKYPLPTG
jgi:hypothetical protein